MFSLVRIVAVTVQGPCLAEVSSLLQAGVSNPIHPA